MAAMRISGRYFGLGVFLALVSSGTGMVVASRNFGEIADPSPSETFIINPDPSPSPTPTPTPTPTPYIKPSPKPTPTPEVIPTPTPSASVYELTNRFAGQYGIDANVLRYVAQCESGFNPAARNGPYFGLFQFSANTWKSNRAIMGEDPDPNLRLNAEEATQTAAYMISRGKAYSWPNCYPQ